MRKGTRRAVAAVAAAVVSGGAVGCGDVPGGEAGEGAASAADGTPPATGELARAARAIFTGEGARWVDLTHAFDERAVYWPTAEPFRLETVADGVTDAGYYYTANRFSAAEHGGTHLDAPVHFHRGGATAEEIPFGRFVGPAAVVDVSAAASGDPDYRVTAEDLRAWEATHGRIPDGAVVLIRTGWGRFWPDAGRYLGTAERGAGAVPDLHFPGLHPGAARWLSRERSVDAVGLDTPSIDYGQSSEFRAHRILYAAGIPGLENVARLEELPPTGAYVVALPMKIAGGSGAPLRIAGVVPRDDGG